MAKKFQTLFSKIIANLENYITRVITTIYMYMKNSDTWQN